MNKPSRYSDYAAILFIDSMVVLEGKHLECQPWSEIDPDGPILILVVPQVAKEIDKRKRDGRLAMQARAFNRLIMPAAVSGKAETIVEGTPRVDIALAVTDKLNWDALGDLDPDDADARVVAQVIHTREVPLERRIFLSQDINAIGVASRHGVKTCRLADHWLREAEPNPHQKELMKLKSRVRELEANEPKFEMAIVFDAEEPFQHYVIQPLDRDVQKALIERILFNNPPIVQRRSSFVYSMTDYDTEYDNKYAEYRDNTVPTYARELHKHLERMYSQVAFKLYLGNTGHIQAEGLILTIATRSGTLSDRWRVVPLQPVAPKPDPLRSFVPNLHLQDMIPASVGRHEMSFSVGPDEGDIIEVNCADFRHGREWEFEGVATIDPTSDSPFIITVGVTAANMRGSLSSTFELSHIVEQKLVSDFINFDEGRFRIDLPMADELQIAMQSEDFSRFKIVRFGVERDDDD